MPQLDYLILQSQLNFLILFFIGYFFFLKFILPVISFSLKLKHKLVLSNLNWFHSNFNYLIFYKKNFLFTLLKLVNLFKVFNLFSYKNFIFFNLYFFIFFLKKFFFFKKKK